MSLAEYRSERGRVCFEPGTYARLHREAPTAPVDRPRTPPITEPRAE